MKSATIAVISDTHMNQPPGWFLRVYEQYLAPAHAVLHCGDITGPATYHELCRHPRFHAVLGNCDWDPNLSNDLPPMLRLELLGLRIGMAHGWGSRSSVPLRVAEAFGPEFDLICFGHTHQQYWSDEFGPQMLNPGSLGEFGSLALVTVAPGKALSCEFVTVFTD
ncbi:metallophosphoesterase family protein [Paucidesulfovibrio longus]|uniref:metallophosphoesterase family protein n=1 Tax=Paucidesulfovibrio longus TaxID=889 RepID=UPI0003B4EEF9|nr:YfcE family phosphodiesterase [Paucidesulfovibrio longus]